MTEHAPTTASRGQGQPPRTYTAYEWIKGYAAWIVTLPIYLALWLFAKVFPRLPARLHVYLIDAWYKYVRAHPLDVRIPANPKSPAYMRRWWRIPRNAFFNIYYHEILKSDEAAALHDHPWWNFSIVIEGGYYEHEIEKGGVNRKTWYGAGRVRFRPSGAFSHRLELPSYHASDITDEDADIGFGTELPAKTIFITGPVLRRWGFHHTDKWVDAYDWDYYCHINNIKTDRMAGYAEQNTRKD